MKCLKGGDVIDLVLLGSGQCHIETSRVVQEADALVLVGSHARQNDEVLLSALESVHTGDFHLLKQDRKRMWGQTRF